MMVHKLIKSLLTFVLVLSLFLPSAQTALAAPPVTSSPEKPLAYADTWADIQPGEWQWYAFKYHFDDSGDAPTQPAQIRLTARPSDSVTLELLNGDQVNAWEQGEKLESFGAATTVQDTVRFKVDIGDFCDMSPQDPICDDGGDIARSQCENKRDPANTDDTCNYSLHESRGYATWAGTIGASGTYYILVRRAANADGPAQVRFTIGGDGVTMK